MANKVFFCLKSCLLGDDVEKIVQPGRPQMTIERMRIACWIPNATDIVIANSTYCFSTATLVA
jgi:hypothetical protein